MSSTSADIIPLRPDRVAEQLDADALARARSSAALRAYGYLPVGETLPTPRWRLTLSGGAEIEVEADDFSIAEGRLLLVTKGKLSGCYAADEWRRIISIQLPARD